MKVYDEVKQALQDIVAPELRELRALFVEIKRFDEKMESLRRQNQEFAEIRDAVRDWMDEMRMIRDSETKAGLRS